jgi:inward rectifier potassium channel
VGVSIVLSTPFSSPSRELLSRFPLDQAHLSERFGLVILVTVGESLFDILGLLGTQPATDVRFFARGLYVLAILAGVWWIYFDDVAGTKLREGPVRFLIWQYAHWPMAASLIGTGVALQHMLTVEGVSQVPADLRWLLAGSLAGVFAMVAAIDSVSERRQTDLSDAWRVRARYAFSVVLLLLAAGGARLSPDAFMASCAAICVVQVLIDMTMAPRSDVDRHLGAVTTADLARSRVEEERSSSRRSLNDPIRKGAPPELRQDLYFWFMQGSWTRLLSLLMGGYLALNVVFAGLFMVMDGTIRGADAGSFRDAFSFSVQTFSTIGYGAMSPANAYGDVLVAIEAAVGLLAVALATGLVFAKVARPESKVLFSRPFCITTWNGKKTLMFRAGNARGNEVVDAQITVSILQDELSPEGHHFRRLHDLELTRSRSPIFRLTWTVMHVIDEDSPLAQVDWSAPGEHFLGMIVTIVGHDATYGQTVHARHYYEPSDARADHVFVDMLLGTNDGRLLVDYDLMHQTRPVEPAVTP